MALATCLVEGHLGFGEVFSCNDEPLDLRGAFVDLVYLSVSHQLLDGVLGVEAVATEDLRANIECKTGKKRKDSYKYTFPL